jgi:RNA polymerase sigma factor (sigma-70 family)
MYTNKEILDGLIRDDEAIVKNIYRKLHPMISSWIKKNNGSSDDTKDILQEAFLILICKIKDEGITLECSFYTYLFSICKHLWFEELRNRSKVQTNDLQNFVNLSDEIPDDDLEEKKLNIYLYQLNRLESKCRTLLLLYCKKKPLFEIMQIMGFKNPQAVADKKKNCRKRLIQNLLRSKEYKELQSEVLVNY